MAKYFSTYDAHRYSTEEKYKESIDSNIRQFWTFVAVPDGYTVIEFYKNKPKRNIVVVIQSSTETLKYLIENNPGLYKLSK